MNRPFFVHTPRNVFGEHLTACPFTIRSVFEPRVDLREISDRSIADFTCKQMNDNHEAEMMAGLI